MTGGLWPCNIRCFSPRFCKLALSLPHVQAGSHAKYKCYICAQMVPDMKTMQVSPGTSSLLPHVCSRSCAVCQRTIMLTGTHNSQSDLCRCLLAGAL